ncbi:MAG: DUF1640 domain-containing protein [Gammaproteobacteria bacterium]|jgi:hypothetical protein|nr:DUF1640 domain-containing protein [Gammaproteobacteria bacterium]
MRSVVELYEALASAPDERARARVIAEAFERLEERYPHLPELVTQDHLRESELRLTREIEQVRADLTIRIEQLRGEVMAAIERSRNTLLLWLIPLLFAQVGAIAALVKLL